MDMDEDSNLNLVQPFNILMVRFWKGQAGVNLMYQTINTLNLDVENVTEKAKFVPNHDLNQGCGDHFRQ